MAVKMLNEASFDAAITANKTVLVDLFAEWCGPLPDALPVVEELSEERPDVAFYKVNVDEDPVIAARFGVSSIPTLLCFRDGKLAKTSVGFCTKEEIEALLSV